MTKPSIQRDRAHDPGVEGMRLEALVDDVSGNVAIYCSECGDLVLAIETDGTTDSILEGHEHETGRVKVNLEAV